jgi:hypothetical protein
MCFEIASLDSVYVVSNAFSNERAIFYWPAPRPLWSELLLSYTGGRV